MVKLNKFKTPLKDSIRTIPQALMQSEKVLTSALFFIPWPLAKYKGELFPRLISS